MNIKSCSVVGKFVLAGLVLSFVNLSFAATEKVWTGGASGNWYTPGNWEPSGVPTADSIVTFNSSATVKLDQNGDADCWAIIVNAGEVRIETDLPAKATVPTAKDDGPWLNMKSTSAGTDINGWNVKMGAKLDIAVPIWCATRTDKWYGGELWFHAPLRLEKTSYFGYGTNCFAQGANVYADAEFHVGLGDSSTGLRDCVIFTDNAIFNGNQIRFTGSDSCSSMVMEVDGDDVSIEVNYFHMNPSSKTADQYLVIKRGTLKVNREFYTELVTDGIRPGHILQTGGTFITCYHPLTSYRGTFRQEGGVYDCQADMSFSNGTFYDFAGGEFRASYLESSSDKNLYLEDWIHVSGEEAVFDIPEKGTLHWNFDKTVIEPQTKIVKKGAGDLRISKSEAVTRPLAVRGGSATLAAGVTLTAPDGSDAAWSLELGDGAEFKFTDITSRLSLPVNVAITGSGKFAFANGSPTARGLVVARSVTTNGVALAKGRYALADGIVSGSTGSSLVIPYRWTGAGGSESFVDPDNWEGGVVPPSGLNTPVDLSAATRVEIAGDYSLTSVVYLPTGANRQATLAVDGTLSLVTDESNWYSCATYVKEGCRLSLDTKVIQRGDTRGPMSMIGGGTVAAKGDFPGLLWTDGVVNYLPFSIDGTLAFNGVSQIYKGNINPNDFPFLMLWTHEMAGCGKVRIEDGADISSTRLFVGDNRFNTLDEIRQTGGEATFGTVYLEKTVADNGHASYFLEGGTLTVNGIFGLDYSYNDTINPLRRPGPSMTMTGGTWNQLGPLYLYGNQNRVKVLGGTVTLGGNWEISTAGGSCAVVEPNTDHFYFGGATLKAVSASTVKGNITLTGIGGDTTLDADEAGLSFGSWGGYGITGPGGVVMNGSAGKVVATYGNQTFTGGITINAAYYAYIGNDLDPVQYEECLNGPRFIKANNATCMVSVRATVLKDPEVISVKDVSKFRCEGKYSGGHEFKVKRFILNGEEKPDGTYNANNCTITVQHDTTWLNGDKGNLSYVGDSVAENDVKLSELRYTPFEPETESATLSGSSTVTLADGAVIEVSEGQTLVVSTPVRFSGNVRKIGFGKVIFTGPVTGGAQLTVELGDAEFAGSLEELTVTAAPSAERYAPGVALADGLVLHDTAALDIQDGAQFAMDGTISFVQNDAAGEQIFDLPFTGSATIVQKGPGTLVWNSETDPVAIRAEAGVVRFGAGGADLSGTALVLDGAVTVDLSEVDLVTVLSAEVNGMSAKAGDYVEGKKALGKRITGAGTMRVLTGSGPGSLILVR